MEPNEIMRKVDTILEETGTGILTAPDTQGNPHLRWMTPTILKGREKCIYALTSPRFSWIRNLPENPSVEWMFQRPSLNQIINLSGKLNIMDNPSLKSELLEKIGKRITVLWKINVDVTTFVVLETIIEKACFFTPMKGTKIKIDFTEAPE